MNDQRLLIPLADLPGLYPVGLDLWTLGGPDGADRWSVSVLDTDGRDWPAGDLLVYDGRWRTTESWWLYGDGPRDTTWSVDLSDAATRDRCLRWLAGRVGIDTRGRCPWWRDDAWGDGWWVGYDADGTHTAFGDGREHHVPVLADLDPTDDTRLPDGSRLVDALALAAVLRHVGGAA